MSGSISSNHPDVQHKTQEYTEHTGTTTTTIKVDCTLWCYIVYTDGWFILKKGNFKIIPHWRNKIFIRNVDIYEICMSI